MKNKFFELLRFDGYLIYFDFAYWHHEAMVYFVKVSEEIFTSSRESSCTRSKKKYFFTIEEYFTKYRRLPSQSL
jgi:hypothetical protein